MERIYNIVEYGLKLKKGGLCLCGFNNKVFILRWSTKEVLQYRKYGKSLSFFLKQLVISGFGTVLDKANVTVEEATDAVDALVEANTDLTLMTEQFNAFASANSEAFASLAEAQTGRIFP